MIKVMKNLICLIFVFLVFIFTISLKAQEEVLKGRLTRGKLWICCLPNGSIEKDMTTYHTWRLMYSGHYYAQNELGGDSDDYRIFNVAQINGESVGWEWRIQRTQTEVYAEVQTRTVKNYNLLDPTQPEEYLEGVIGSYKVDDLGNPHMAFRLNAKTMVWGLPKYDDFVIIHCKLTNIDDVTFENFYYARTLHPVGPPPHDHSYEEEYIWDNEISEEIGFIFYDDTSWPPPTKGDSAIYDIFPGNITGDRGNPGNIEVVGSRDRKLYNPYLYAFSFIPQYITPNKFGEKKVWRTILSNASDAPIEERYPGHDAMQVWQTFVNVITNEQPKISWREAHAKYQEGDLSGSLWERNPRYIYAIGPYDIEPGESIEWIEIFIAGQMDRNITILGDTIATKHFVEEGLKNLKENWGAAKELIENNFAVLENVPPPTPADAPMLGNENELIAEPGMGVVDGIEKSGVYLKFNPIHLGYSDPITGINDVEGYKIYRSNIDVEGPWEIIDTLRVEDADKFIENGKIVYFVPAEISIPFRYAVTSFDRNGNESAIKAYTIDPIAAQALPTNNLDRVRVVPNPFRQQSGFAETRERKRIAFINLPEKCTIRIYTLSLELIRTIEHDGGGEETWGTNEGNDYLLTDFGMNVSPGIYIYHIESHVAGHEGESKVGKIFIIK